MMDQPDVAAYCLSRPGAVATHPLRENEPAYTVSGVPFAHLGTTGGEIRVTLRAGLDAAESTDVRLRHPRDVQIVPYEGRNGWVEVRLGSGVPDDELRALLDLSHALAQAAGG
jgi:predicted DNA-binding protein (MmcQ/YjbR family)